MKEQAYNPFAVTTDYNPFAHRDNTGFIIPSRMNMLHEHECEQNDVWYN